MAVRELDKAGLGIDFKILKKETNRVLDLLDHKYLNEIPPFNEFSPSSENIARFLYEKIGEVLNNDNVKIYKVNVWESDNACASYFED